jgi:hypothetical protein
MLKNQNNEKIYCISYSCSSSVCPCRSSDSDISNGDKVLNAGIGLGSLLGTSYSTAFPPVSASLEFGVADHVLDKGSIGVAPYLGIGSYKYSYYSGSQTYTFTVVGVRGAFHYPLISSLDTYAGILAGYLVVSGTHESNAIQSRPAGELFIGGRYYFNPKWAAFFELGIATVPVHIGVAVRL